MKGIIRKGYRGSVIVADTETDKCQSKGARRLIIIYQQIATLHNSSQQQQQQQQTQQQQTRTEKVVIVLTNITNNNNTYKNIHIKIRIRNTKRVLTYRSSSLALI